MQKQKRMKNVKGKVVVKVDMEFKNSHRFADGTTIRLERGVENLNRREVAPVNAVVVASDLMPCDSQVLIHHNATHATNEVTDHNQLSGEDIAKGVKLFAIPENECFLYREPGEKDWKPCFGFATALRIFKPVDTLLVGVEPILINRALWITSGEHKQKAVITLHACDYEIVFQGDDGREKRIIRLRHFEGEYNERQEIIAVDGYMTKQILKGELLVGLTPQDAKIFDKGNV